MLKQNTVRFFSHLFKLSKKIKKSFLFITLYSITLYSQWVTIVPGVEYQKFTLPDPNDVYVVRINRKTANLLLDVGVGGATIRDLREPVSKIVSRYQNVVNYNGECYNIVAAVNGDFFSYTTDQVTGGQVIAGSYVDKMGNRGKYAYCRDDSMWIEETVTFSAGVFFVDGSSESINNVNVPRGTNELILYTHHYDYSTFTTNDGCEVVVGEVCEPLQANKDIVGVIKEVRTEGQAPALIPFDGFVLSASGEKKEVLKNKCKVGDVLRVKISVSSNLGNDWSKTYSVIEGAQWFVSNGQLTSDLWEERHPRTAVAYNNNYIYLVVCDGRRSTSIGMKLSELGNFCIQYLQAQEALNLDGGGSSTMWVNGEVKNRPSDGTERAVANALFVAQVNIDKSNRFNYNNEVKTISQTNLKLGPGTQFGNISTLEKNTICSISSSPLNGVYAKNQYWWKVKYNELEGWVSQSVLADTIPPTVPQLISPANNVQIYDRNPIFSWSSVEDPDGVYYTLIISSSIDFSSSVIYVTNLSTSQYTPEQHGDFKVNTTYYWKVKAVDGGENESSYSEIFKFVILSSGDVLSPGKVETLSAQPGWLTGSILLSWISPGNDGYNGDITNGMYRIDFSTYDKITWDHHNYKIKITTSVQVNTPQKLLITGLVPNITYYFCIWTTDEFFQWSEQSNIAVSYAKPAPAVPIIFLPQDNSVFITTNTVTLIWDKDLEIVNSYIEISTFSNFSFITASATVLNSNTYMLNNLENNTYYLRIRGETQYKEKSSWSTCRKFYVKLSTDIFTSDFNVLYEQISPQQINFLPTNFLTLYFNISLESKTYPVDVTSITCVYKLKDENDISNTWYTSPVIIDDKTGSFYVEIFNSLGNKLRSIDYFTILYLNNGQILQMPVNTINYVKKKQQVVNYENKIVLYDINPYDREVYVEVNPYVDSTEKVITVEQYFDTLPECILSGVVFLNPPIAIKITGLSKQNKDYGICCIPYNETIITAAGYNAHQIRMLFYNGVQWHTVFTRIDINSSEVKGKLLGDGIYALAIITDKVNYNDYKPKQYINFAGNRQPWQVTFPIITIRPEVEIKIYDVKGRLVRNISKIESWDGKDNNGRLVPTGTYIYKYVVDGKHYTGTILLLK